MDTKPTRAFWSRFGGQLGVGLCTLGFLLVFLGWNGAASVDRIQSQFPYLISGGIAGLCFVVLGVGMIIVQNQRADRAALQATLRELQDSLERAGLAEGDGAARKPFAKPGPRPVPPIDDTAQVVLPIESPAVREGPLVAAAAAPEVDGAPRPRASKPRKAASKKAPAKATVKRPR